MYVKMLVLKILPTADTSMHVCQDYDIAILRLKTSVPLSSVALPPEGANETYAGRSAVILGWGTTSQGNSMLGQL